MRMNASAKWMIMFSLIGCSLAINSLRADYYFSGAFGSYTPIDTKNSYKGSVTIGAGYQFPALLKTEIFFKQMGSPMAGIGGRFNFFPLLNINGGLVYRFEHEQKKAGEGFYFGPGVHFELLPVIDLFGDLNFYNVRGDQQLNAEVGARIHF